MLLLYTPAVRPDLSLIKLGLCRGQMQLLVILCLSVTAEVLTSVYLHAAPLICSDPLSHEW